MKRISLALFFTAVALGCSGSPESSDAAVAAEVQPTADVNPIVGVWSVSEIVSTDPDRNSTAGQPGFAIFTERHYSRTEVHSEQPRETLPEQATDEQLAVAYRFFAANAGTYEIRGNEVTITRVAAKSPNAMVAGNFTTYTFSIDGNALTLTEKASAAGPTDLPTTWRFTRVE